MSAPAPGTGEPAIHEWTVASEESDLRLDQMVAGRLEAARNQVQQWIRDEAVTVDGTPRRASFRLSPGAKVICRASPKEAAGEVEPEDGPLSLLYEDDDVVVIDKPAGLAMHPGAGRRTGTLAHRLLHRYPEIAAVGGRDRPGIVHRLDLDTTGAVCIARNERSYLALQKAFGEREVHKSYLAIALGEVGPDAGRIEEPIGRHPKHRRRMAVRSDGRSARTRYRVLGRVPGATLMELDLETGRTHQIRVHLLSLGHPLVGDSLYSGQRARSAPATTRGVLQAFPRPALHAWKLSLSHPADGSRLAISAPLPADLRDLWRALGGGELPRDPSIVRE